MAAKKLKNVHQALEYLENLDVSSEDDLSDNEDFISRGGLVILPPNEQYDRDTDENSGDENELFPNSLSLGAPVVANLGKLSVMQTSNYHIVITIILQAQLC